MFGGLHKVLFSCLCCCGLVSIGLRVVCLLFAVIRLDNWSFPRVSWLYVSSHLLHVTCFGDADLVFENLFSCAKTSRSLLSSLYSSAWIISVFRSDTLYALKKIRRLGVLFSLMTLNVFFVEQLSGLAIVCMSIM